MVRWALCAVRNVRASSASLLKKSMCADRRCCCPRDCRPHRRLGSAAPSRRRASQPLHGNAWLVEGGSGGRHPREGAARHRLPVRGGVAVLQELVPQPLDVEEGRPLGRARREREGQLSPLSGPRICRGRRGPTPRPSDGVHRTRARAARALAPAAQSRRIPSVRA